MKTVKFLSFNYQLSANYNGASNLTVQHVMAFQKMVEKKMTAIDDQTT